MEKNYLLESNKKVARTTRIVAKLIDIVIALFFGLLFYPWGIIISIAYMSISDSMHDGQSVGKRIIGFAVVSLEDGSPCSLKQSIVRNLPFLIPLGFSIIPIWGWIFSGLFAVSLIVLELYLLIQIESGHRLGDVMADTTVVSDVSGHEGIGHRMIKWFRPLTNRT